MSQKIQVRSNGRAYSVIVLIEFGKPTVLGGYEEGTRYLLKLICGSFLEVWEGRGLSQPSKFSSHRNFLKGVYYYYGG
jgi:hypothetical protein